MGVHNQMKKKKTIGIGIVVIMLIGIVTAGLVGYLSNMVSASVEVKGLVFYANSEKIDLFGKEVKKLSINTFSSSTANYTITGIDSEVFWTEEFDEPLNFYKLELKLYVRAKIVEGDIPKGLDLIFGYYSGDNTYEICRETVSINSNELEPYSTTCQGLSEIDDLDGFYYEIKGKATPDVDTRISLTNQETKVEVLGATQ